MMSPNGIVPFQARAMPRKATNIQRKLDTRDRDADDEPVRCMPARDAAAARQAREGQAVQDEGVDRQQHDQDHLGLQLGIGEVVGACSSTPCQTSAPPVA